MTPTLHQAEFSVLRGRIEPSATIIAVGGGKGGVGKSFVSSSLAFFLAQLGHETLAIDCDLGGANLHTNLGLPLSNMGVNEFIQDPSLRFEEIIQNTPMPNLKIISGSSETLDTANVDEVQRSRLMSAIFNHSADYIVLDLSAGTHHATLDFFLMAQHKVTVFTPEPPAVENAYRFLKAAYFRKLRRYEHQLQLKSQIDDLMNQRGEHKVKNPADLMQKLVDREPVLGGRMKKMLGDLNFEIVLNQARTRQEMEIGHSVQSVCGKYFGIPCQFLGGLEYDNAVWQSLRQKSHLLMANRQTHLYAQLMAMARKLAKPKTPLKAAA